MSGSGENPKSDENEMGGGGPWYVRLAVRLSICLIPTPLDLLLAGLKITDHEAGVMLSSCPIFVFLPTAMGADQSLLLNQRGSGASPLHSLILERALLDALSEISEVPSEQLEHAWDPEDCSPKFRVLSDRLTARRLPSPLTTDAIRGMELLAKP